MPALPRGVFAPGALAYDMVYGRATPVSRISPRREGAAGRRRPRHARRAGGGVVHDLARREARYRAGHRAACAASVSDVAVSLALYLAPRAARAYRAHAAAVLVFRVRLVLVGSTIPTRPLSCARGWSVCARTKPGARVEYRWVPYRSISPHLKRAVVAAEDARFVQHDGFDWDGITQSAMKRTCAKAKSSPAARRSRSSSRRIFSSPGDRAFWRKAQEAAITVMIELLMDKRRILELYLNVIEWGDGVFGAEAAARLSLRAVRRRARARAGRAPRRDDPEPPPLRPGTEHGVPAAPDADATGAHERGARAVRRAWLRQVPPTSPHIFNTRNYSAYLEGRGSGA